MSSESETSFTEAVLYLATVTDDSEMTTDEAATFWEQLATYALDTASELRTPPLNPQ